MKHRFPFFLGLLLCLAEIGCTRYFFRRAAPADVQLANSRTKIALVGFYPFRILPGTSRTEFEAELIYDDRFKEKLGLGRPIGEFRSRGYRRVPEKRVHGFIKVFLENVGKTGVTELQNLIVPAGKGYRVKRVDADYYLVGVLLPVAQSGERNFLSTLSSFGSCLTLGIFPYYAKYRSRSLVYLFDRNLKLLHDFEMVHSYSSLSTWWMPPYPGRDTELPDRGPAPPLMAWEPDMIDLRRDVIRYLNSLN